MPNLTERFVGRFEIWRRSVPLRNPLNVPAAILAILIAQSVYGIATSHFITLRAGLLLVIDIVFLILYFRSSPLAWLVLPVWGIMALMTLPFVLASDVYRYSLRVIVGSIAFLLITGVVFILWGFLVRHRYYAYIGYRASKQTMKRIAAD
jgi:hypothetical protein